MRLTFLHRSLTIFLALIASHGLQAATLQIGVQHSFKGEPLLLDSLRYAGSAGETLSLTRVSYLLSGFALETDDGRWIETDQRHAFLDAEKRRTSFALGGIPAGHYRAFRFDVGLAPADNSADPAKLSAHDPLNPNLNGLHWSWQGGYIFLALEGHYRTGSNAPLGFVYHLARDPSRTRINLAVSLDLSRDAGMLLDFDLGTLLSAPRPLSFAKDGVATHSREADPISAALVANLPGAFRVALLDLPPPPAPAAPIRPLYLPAKFTPYRFTISRTFPLPALPRDNPLIDERVALGRELFHDPQLSRDGSISCASCHLAANGFADPRRFSVGVEGRTGTRHGMPLINLAWKSLFFWDGRAPSLREQVLFPIQDHAEMDEKLDHVVAKLTADPRYAPLFAAAFDSAEITPEKIGLAVEQFLLTLTAYDSKFDRSLRGEATLTPAESRGFELFMTEYDPRTRQYGADCFHCHGGPLFTDHQFHNNGLAPTEDLGRFRITGQESDRAKFSTPTLRNVAKRAPYMHDGRFDSLAKVVAHYSSGVHRSETLDPNLAKHPDGGLYLSAKDQEALVAFLESLSEP